MRRSVTIFRATDESLIECTNDGLAIVAFSDSIERFFLVKMATLLTTNKGESATDIHKSVESALFCAKFSS